MRYEEVPLFSQSIILRREQFINSIRYHGDHRHFDVSHQKHTVGDHQKFMCKLFVFQFDQGINTKSSNFSLHASFLRMCSLCVPYVLAVCVCVYMCVC